MKSKKIKKGLFVRCKNVIFGGYNRIGNGSHIEDCDVGRYTYFSSKCSVLHTKIGNFCSIGSGVKIIYGDHPTRGFVSTHPVFYSVKPISGISFVKENKFLEFKYVDSNNHYMVEIGNDVWIGSHSIILSGVRIGDGAVIAAGSVVTKDVEPYSIVAGVPAKEIRKRFNSDEVDFLLQTKWWYKDDLWIQEHANDFENISIFAEKMKSSVQ